MFVCPPNAYIFITYFYSHFKGPSTNLPVVKMGELAGEGPLIWQLVFTTCHMSHATLDMFHLTFDTWPLTLDTWRMTADIFFVIFYWIFFVFLILFPHIGRFNVSHMRDFYVLLHLLGEAWKKTIESVIMILPRQTPPPFFFKTVIALGYLFLCCYFSIKLELLNYYKVCFGA